MDFFALATGACLGPPLPLGAEFVALLHLLVLFVSSLRVGVSVNRPADDLRKFETCCSLYRLYATVRNAIFSVY